MLIIKFQVYLEIAIIGKMKDKNGGKPPPLKYPAVAAGRETVLLFRVIGRPLLCYSRIALDAVPIFLHVCSAYLYLIRDEFKGIASPEEIMCGR